MIGAGDHGGVRRTLGVAFLAFLTAYGGSTALSSLEYVTSLVTEWHGWSAYHPGTMIWDGG